MEIDEEQQNESGVASASRQAALQQARHPMEFLLKRANDGHLKQGDMVEGVVIERDGPRLFVDLGPQGVGIVYGREYNAARDIIAGLKSGDPVSAKVVELDNEEGYVELSLKDAGEERRWHDLKQMIQEGMAVELPVIEANRGGLILELKGIKGFLPASQLSQKHYPRVEGGDKEKIYQELLRLVGTPLKVKVLDVNPQEQKLIFSEKELDQEAIRSALAKYKIGDEVEGDVTGVVDFGAFMKFDEAGLEGLIHISEIDWTLIADPREVLKPGEHLYAKIIDIQGDKVSLSLKALKEDPWKKIAEKYHKGDMASGRVIKFNPFGAFVEVNGEIQGLVHISEFGIESRMRSELELGKEYEFKVLLIDPAEHRFSLGMVRGETSSENNSEPNVSPDVAGGVLEGEAATVESPAEVV